MIELKFQTTAAKEPIKHSEGCLICGKELIYAETGNMQKCIYCDENQHSNIICPDGHFICNECHRAEGSRMIEVIVEKTTQTNPIELAREIMGTPAFHMHGPEHHQLVPATLLATLRNLGIAIETAQIQDAIFRSSQLPGGICGSWGSCGAALGAGIGLSVLRHLTSLKKEGWGETNRDTGEVLQRVGAYGGPRCCKRSTYSALLAAIDILEREEVAVFPQEAHATPICKDFWRNKQCIKLECPYYPQKKKII